MSRREGIRPTTSEFSLLIVVCWARLNLEVTQSFWSAHVKSSNDGKSIHGARLEGVPPGTPGISTGIALWAIGLVALACFGPVRANDSASMPVAQPVSLPPDRIHLSIATLRDLARTRPIAAVALISIMRGNQSPLSNQTIGNSIILTAVPGPDTVKRILEHADAAIVMRTMQPLLLNPYALDHGPFLRIWWIQSALSNDELLLRISAELVDGEGVAYKPPEPVEAQTIVSLRKSDAGLLRRVR
jgi:hypothetical protein